MHLPLTKCFAQFPFMVRIFSLYFEFARCKKQTAQALKTLNNFMAPQIRQQ